MPVTPGVVELDIRRVHVAKEKVIACEVVGIRNHWFWISRRSILEGRLSRAGDSGGITISERAWEKLVSDWHKEAGPRRKRKRRRRRK